MSKESIREIDGLKKNVEQARDVPAPQRAQTDFRTYLRRNAIMRTYFALSLSSVLSLFFFLPQLAAADSPAGCGCAPCGSAAPATTSGCCAPHNHSNDNAWDGFCQEQACWQAVWKRVGTGTLLSGGCKTCTPCQPKCRAQLRPMATATCQECRRPHLATVRPTAAPRILGTDASAADEDSPIAPSPESVSPQVANGLK
jgi:hypothetical protein